MTTTANLDPVINHIANHLAAQRKPSKLHNHPGSMTCAYRGKGQTMCAVGCLFSDEAYEKDDKPENIGVPTLLDSDEHPAVFKEVMAWKPEGLSEFDFAEALDLIQCYHDGTERVLIHYETTLADFEGKPDEELAAQIVLDLREVLAGKL